MCMHLFDPIVHACKKNTMVEYVFFVLVCVVGT